MQDTKFTNKEPKDFATILAENFDKTIKELTNERTSTFANPTTNTESQQPPTNAESRTNLPSPSDSQGRRASGSETLATLGLRVISLPTQRPHEITDSQGRDGEASRSAERERGNRKRDIRDSERAERNSESIEATKRDNAITGRAGHQNKAIQSRIRRVLSIGSATDELAHLAHRQLIAFKDLLSKHSELRDSQANITNLQQLATKAYTESKPKVGTLLDIYDTQDPTTNTKANATQSITKKAAKKRR